MQIGLRAFIILFFTSFSMLAQTENDTIKGTLDEVVITGQIEPQSIKKSIQNVRVITKQDIRQLAANNLGELLTQYINITVRPSGTDGRSTVSMFGLDALYFKILVDNVPLVNEAGLGNNIDLSQINLNDVERIEIIEGSMGVTHGANAVSGILNIITKKSSLYKWGITATVQEETVGVEYSAFKEGRHIQALQLNHSFNRNWYASVNVNRNDFQGFLSDREGKDYDVNDGKRGFAWLPKEQLMGNALISYSKANTRIFYRFELLDENTDYYNSAVETGFTTELGSYKYSRDSRYYTNRYYHHLNGSGKLFNRLNYNISVSHQKQARETEGFFYRIYQQEEYNTTKNTDQSMEVLYSTGTFSNFFNSSRFKVQLGYEAVNNNGFSVIEDEGSAFTGVRKRLENYDAFTTANITVTENFSISPGLRYSFQSRFDNQYSATIGVRQQLMHNIELRASGNKGFRTPTFEELYYKMIFSGHHFTGNPDLIPETSTSFEASIRKATFFDTGLMLSNSLVVSYMDIKDRITTAFTGYSEDNVPMYEAVNISKYNMWNISSINQLRFNNWNFSLGATLVGVSQLIDNGELQSDDKYVYTLNLNTSASYRVPEWNTVFATYYKYNGELKEYMVIDNEYRLSAVEATNWLDASVTKTFFKDFDFQVGARNILDVTTVNRTNTGPGGSHSPGAGVLLAYGRSYYAKLTYNLNF